MDSLPRGSDSLGRGSGAKRPPSLLEKLSAGDLASEGDIQRALDAIYDPDAAGGWRAQLVALEGLGLLCGAGAGGRLADKLVHGDAFLERLSLTLQQDLHLQKKGGGGGNPDVARAALQLISRLPDEALCKIFASREAATSLHGYVMDHPNSALRAFAIARLASACARCWSFLDRRAFVNGAFEEGSDAQRYKQRVRDWIHDFLSSLVRLCDDPSHHVAAAAFSAIGDSLRGHPLCSTAVDEEIRSFWGVVMEGGPRRRFGGWGGGRGGGDTELEDGMSRHKQAFPMQQLGEIVLRSALPRIRRLIRRQSQPSRTCAPAAIETCSLLLVAALRLSTSPSGSPVSSPLLDPPTAINFLGGGSGGDAIANNALSNGSGNGRQEMQGMGNDNENGDDADAVGSISEATPKDITIDWIGLRLRRMLEGRDPLLAEAAAWATLRVLQPAAMGEAAGSLRVSTAPRVAETFLRLLPVPLDFAIVGSGGGRGGQAPSGSLLGGQQEMAAGAAIALRLAMPSAISTIAPHLLAATERVPEPRQRLAILSDVFFRLLVRPGRASGGEYGGGRAARGCRTRGSSEAGAGGGGGGGRESREDRRVRPLISVLEEDWFVALVSDTPRRARRLAFREEIVVVLATACAQVLAACTVAVLSPASQTCAAIGIGSAASKKGSRSSGRVGVTRTPPPPQTANTSNGNHGNAIQEPLAAGTGAGVGSSAREETLDAAAAIAAAAAAAEKERWSDLEAWLACSLSTLEVCTRCVTWTSNAGYMAGLAYVRLLSLVLRLVCPPAMRRGGGGGGGGDAETANVDLFPDGLWGKEWGKGNRSFAADMGGEQDASGEGKGAAARAEAEGAGGGRGDGPRRFTWARERIVQVVDDLMWRLREGLPGRDVRLRLLQATCTHLRLLAFVSGDEKLTEDASMELVSVLQGELGELDAQAGLLTQPQRGPVLTAGDSADYGGGGGGGIGGGLGGGPGSRRSGSTANPSANPLTFDTPGTQGSPYAAGQRTLGFGGGGGGGGGEDDMGEGGGTYPTAAAFSADKGSMADVMAHELVVGCLVRLALGAEGETAVEVLQVLGHERGRAHARESLGRGAVGPMEEVVAKGIRTVDLLVLQRATAGREWDGHEALPPGAGTSREGKYSGEGGDRAEEGELLPRFLGTMALGWQASVQPDERVLYGARAFVFDPGAHALPELHRRFRRRLCSGAAGSGAGDLDCGVVSGGSDRYGFSGSRSGLREGNHSLKPPTEEEDEGQDNDHGGELVYEEAGVFDDAHPWEEEAPQTQLNGGSDPIVVTATHVVSRSGWRWGSGCSDGGGRGSGVGGAGSVKVRSDGGMGGSSMRTGSAGTLLGDFGSSSGGNASAGGGGGGVLLRIRAYNATNARLHGFIIRLSFGQGAEAAGMGDGGKVEAHVDEVLMPAAAYTLEVPVRPVDGLRDVVVHVTLIFPEAEPEPEFELEGTTEILGGEAAVAGGDGAAGGEGGPAPFGSGPDDDLSGGAGGGGFGGAGHGDPADGGGFVQVTIHAGSYCLPAEAFLGPPACARGSGAMTTSWVGFQTAWGGLPYVHAFAVETCRLFGQEGMLLRTADGVRLAMSVVSGGGSVSSAYAGRGGGGRGVCHDVRASASVRCPGGVTDYSVSAAWAFEAWDGSPVLCALTAMKAPFSHLLFSTGGGGGGSDSRCGGRGEQCWTWCGRMEVRCGSQACASFAQTSAARLTRFVTNGVFASIARDGRHRPQQQRFRTGGVGSAEAGATATADLFNRTDLSACGGMSGREVVEQRSQVLPLVLILKQEGRVDTT